MSTNNQLAWPNRENCFEIIIKKYNQEGDRAVNKNDEDQPIVFKLIADQQTIDRVFDLLYKLPVDGEMMKSFSDETPLTTLEFKYGKSTKTVFIFGGRVKTPSTRFLTEQNCKNDEKLFVELIHWQKISDLLVCKKLEFFLDFVY